MNATRKPENSELDTTVNIALVAGGTGGHLIPAIIVAKKLHSKAAVRNLLFVGTGTELEKKLLANVAFNLEAIPARAVHGGGICGAFKFALTLPRAMYACVRLFREKRPSVVVGFGGYPSFVPILVAWLMRIPTAIHESNVGVGLANKVLSLIATKVFGVTGCKGFIGTSNLKLLPNPVREEFYSIPPFKYPESGEPFRILVVGGSQGAVTLNTIVLGLCDVFQECGVELHHQSGVLDYQRVMDAYRATAFKAYSVSPFVDDMAKAYARAHLVICRAGAMSVAEVVAAGRPVIFVPLVIASGHQRLNAEPVAEAGGGIIVEQDKCCAEKLRQHLSELLSSREKLETMARCMEKFRGDIGVTSAERIAEDIMELGLKHNV